MIIYRHTAPHTHTHTHTHTHIYIYIHRPVVRVFPGYSSSLHHNLLACNKSVVLSEVNYYHNSSILFLMLQDFEGGDIDELCEFLKKLATESAKRIAKKDRRQQRSTFRDVLRSIEVRNLLPRVLRGLPRRTVGSSAPPSEMCLGL